MNISIWYDLKNILSVFLKAIIFLFACLISAGVMMYYALTSGDKEYCLDTGRCAEGLEINTEHGLMLINKKNCLENGYEWSKGYCFLNKRNEGIRKKSKLTFSSFIEFLLAGSFIVSAVFFVSILIFLPVILFIFYKKTNVEPLYKWFKVGVGLVFTFTCLNRLFFDSYFTRKDEWMFFFYSLCSFLFLICFWIVLFKKMPQGQRIWYAVGFVCLWLIGYEFYPSF